MTRALSVSLALLLVATAQAQPAETLEGAYRTEAGPLPFRLVRAPEGDTYGGLLVLDEAAQDYQRLVLSRTPTGAWTLEVRQHVQLDSRGGALDVLDAGRGQEAAWGWSDPQRLALDEDGPGLLHPDYALQHPDAPEAAPPRLRDAALGDAPTRATPFVIYGHRGLPTLHPENTAPSIEAALEAGANGVEIDLCLTADGEVVLWHDNGPGGLVALVRNLGFEGGMAYMPNYPPLGSRYRRATHELTLAELRAHYGYSPRRFTLGDLDPEPGIEIPTLDQVGPLLARCERFILDVKIPDPALAPRFVARVDEVLRKHGIADKAVFMHAEAELVDALRAALPSHYALSHDREITRLWGGGDPEDYSAVAQARARNLRVGSVGRPRTMLWGGWKLYSGVLRHDRAQIDAAGDGMELIAWTLNDADELREVLAIRVDGVVTDDPALVRSLQDVASR